MEKELILLSSSFSYIIPVLIFTVISLKIWLYFSFKTSEWKFYNLIYFNNKQILSQSQQEKPDIKIVQNALTYYVAFLSTFFLLLTILTSSGSFSI